MSDHRTSAGIKGVVVVLNHLDATVNGCSPGFDRNLLDIIIGGIPKTEASTGIDTALRAVLDATLFVVCFFGEMLRINLVGRRDHLSRQS